MAFWAGGSTPGSLFDTIRHANNWLLGVAYRAVYTLKIYAPFGFVFAGVSEKNNNDNHDDGRNNKLGHLMILRLG